MRQRRLSRVENETAFPDERKGCCVHRGMHGTRRDGSESHVLELLERADADHGGGWLGFEHHFFLGEGVDAFACLHGRLANGGHFEQAGKNEFSDCVFLDVTFDHAGKRFENRSHLLAAELGAVCDAVDDLGLRVLVFNGGSFGCHAY